MDQQLERILQKVRKPARYTGGEYKQIVKDKNAVDLRVAFCFPDTYEIGMSNLGLRIMYMVLNMIGGVWCERVFSPWSDMEEQMRVSGLLLYGLESGDPIRDFDIVAFSLGYELSYTNVLNMLDLAGIPLRCAERGEHVPLIIAGGTCCYNPEPLVDFIDLFVVGEGEEVAGEIIEAYRKSEFGTRKRESREKGCLEEALKDGYVGKREFLLSASAIPGVYVPSLYDVDYFDNGKVRSIKPQSGAPKPVMKRIVRDLETSCFPSETIVPSTEIVHDRVVLELFRGCIRGCRFCQAGHVYRPVRARSSDTLLRQGIEALKLSGYNEISLMSLSSSDYPQIEELCDGLLEYCEPRGIGLALPSLRADNFNIGLMQDLQKVRRSGLTFAPEAGSQRLRDVINKNVTEDEFLETCRIAFAGGWNSVKLYFMLGLPTETDDDVVAIAELSRAVLNTWKQSAVNKSRGVRITVSTSCFIPKPHTPFQWEAQIPMEEYLRRVRLLKDSIRTKAIVYNWHSPEQGFVEAALSRGDRSLGPVLEEAWSKGARLDSWSEFFSINTWLEAFESCGVDPCYYAMREREGDEVLPWSIISTGVSDEFLRNELLLSRENKKTPDCGDSCSGCGVCRVYPREVD